MPYVYEVSWYIGSRYNEISWNINSFPPSAAYTIYDSVNSVSFCSDDGLSPIRHQAII